HPRLDGCLREVRGWRDALTPLDVCIRSNVVSRETACRPRARRGRVLPTRGRRIPGGAIPARTRPRRCRAPRARPARGPPWVCAASGSRRPRGGGGPWTGTVDSPAMKIRAAVLEQFGQPLVVQEIDLAEPRAGEVLVRLVACGVCHTDLYTASGADPSGYAPTVLGHEGAGVVERVGDGVTSVASGDHVVTLFSP